jgi:hypothetical protein
VEQVGYWVVEWLPQMVIFLIESDTEASSFFASWLIARL